MKLLIAYMIILVAISGCGNRLPEFPEVYRCTYSWLFKKFRCKNTKTNAVENRRLDDPRMEAAESISANDSLKAEKWIDNVSEIARQRCN